MWLKHGTNIWHNLKQVYIQAPTKKNQNHLQLHLPRFGEFSSKTETVKCPLQFWWHTWESWERDPKANKKLKHWMKLCNNTISMCKPFSTSMHFQRTNYLILPHIMWHIHQLLDSTLHHVTHSRNMLPSTSNSSINDSLFNPKGKQEPSCGN